MQCWTVAANKRWQELEFGPDAGRRVENRFVSEDYVLGHVTPQRLANEKHSPWSFNELLEEHDSVLV